MSKLNRKTQEKSVKKLAKIKEMFGCLTMYDNKQIDFSGTLDECEIEEFGQYIVNDIKHIHGDLSPSEGDFLVVYHDGTEYDMTTVKQVKKFFNSISQGLYLTA